MTRPMIVTVDHTDRAPATMPAHATALYAAAAWLILCERLGLPPSATVDAVLAAADCNPPPLGSRAAALYDAEVVYPEAPERFYR